MSKDEILKAIKDKFGNRIKKVFEKSYKRVFIDIEAKDITDFVEFIFKKFDARLNTASCVDMPKGMEILYHFSFGRAGVVISFRVYLDKKRLEIESITPIMKAAGWIEREIHELFGIDFKNHPNLKRLLLPDDWPEGAYPLRRDFNQEELEKKMEKASKGE
jgi:Ni,Fe-hydrogenase III component G